MKKRVIGLLMILCTITLLAGCGNDKKDNKMVEVGDYKKIKVDKIDALKVTDADVEAAIRSDLASLNKNTSVNGPAAKWDTVTIDYVGKLNGVAFSGGTANDQQLTLGSGTYIDGFEDGVIGHSVGETFDIKLTFPKNYHNTSLAGKEVVFTITLDKISRLPELTDEILKDIGTKATTVAEYRELCKKEMEVSNLETAKSEMQEKALDELVKISKLKQRPEDRLVRITRDFVYQESYGAIVNNLSIEESVKRTYGKSVKEMVDELLTKELAVEYVAEKENLFVSAKEYDEQVAKMAASYGEKDVDAFEKSFEMIYGEGYIRRMMLQEKVGAFLAGDAMK